MCTAFNPLSSLRFGRLRLPLRPIRSIRDPALICRPFSYDHVVIGAGVVGLAVAAKLAE